jgi:hypothetical protein
MLIYKQDESSGQEKYSPEYWNQKTLSLSSTYIDEATGYQTSLRRRGGIVRARVPPAAGFGKTVAANPENHYTAKTGEASSGRVKNSAGGF